MMMFADTDTDTDIDVVEVKNDLFKLQQRQH